MLLVALDLLELYEPWLERFKAALARCTGVPAERQIVWCNHIHAAPSSDGVAEMPLAERLAWSIDKARADYAAAEVAFASRDLGPGWTIRRRFAVDGLETLCVMYNDGCRLEGDRLEVSQQVCTYLQERGVRPQAWAGFGRAAYCVSPRDVRLEVLAIRRAGDGCPIATVVRFPAHPVIASHSRIGNAIFPDYIGALREVFERARGGCVLFLQGPSGDVRPLHEQYGTEAAELYGRRLGREAVNLAADLRFEPLQVAALAFETARLALRDEYRWDADRLERERLSAQRAAEQAADPAEKLRLHRTAEVLRWVEFFRSERPTIIPARALEEGFWGASVAAVRFGPVVLVGLPGEIFNGTGLKVLERAGSGRAGPVVVTELAEAYTSYLSPPEEYGSGGYEDTSCFFALQAEEELLRAAERVISNVTSY